MYLVMVIEIEHQARNEIDALRLLMQESTMIHVAGKKELEHILLHLLLRSTSIDVVKVVLIVEKRNLPICTGVLINENFPLHHTTTAEADVILILRRLNIDDQHHHHRNGGMMRVTEMISS